MMTVRVHFKDPHNADREITKSTPTKVQPSPVDKIVLQLYLTSMWNISELILEYYPKYLPNNILFLSS